MILDARSGLRGDLVNLDNGKVIPHACWADIPDDGSPGTFVAAHVDAQGNPIHEKQTQADGSTRMVPVLYRGRARLKFVSGQAAVLRPPALATPGPLPARLPSVRRDRELALQSEPGAGKPLFTRHHKVQVPIFSDRCDHTACNRVADWAVSDEVALSPVKGADGRWYSRAQIVRVRYYCAQHYRAPALVTEKGEIIKVYEECGGVRPQWHST